MRTNRIYEIRLIVAGSRTFHDYKLAKEGIPALVAFWDGKSRGTKNMINTADNGRTFVRVIRYDS